jgi:hypothetical protein
MIGKEKRMTAKWIAALAAVGALWTVQAHADDAADTDSDVKCLILGIELSADPDQQLQMPGQMTALYFMGRLNGRAPAQDLQAKITAHAKAMSQADIAATAQSCTTTLSGAGKALVDARDALIKIEADKAAKEPTSKK